MKLEEQVIPERQLDAAYQCTRIDHEIKLNINCKPSPARLTRIIITLSIYKHAAKLLSRYFNCLNNPFIVFI